MRTASVVHAFRLVGQLAVETQPVFTSILSRSTSESGGHCLAFGQRFQLDLLSPPCASAHDCANSGVAIIKKAAKERSVLNLARLFTSRSFPTENSS